MAERFLKSRQEREEQRLGRAKGVSEVTAQRQQFDDQASALESAVEAQLKAGDLGGAQDRLGELRRLVLDASNSVSLTAHDMAKANATLARLQQAHDDRRRAAETSLPADPTRVVEDAEGEVAAVPAGGARRFKFSKKVKTVNASATAEAPVPQAAVVASDASAAGSIGATYGPSEDATLCVPPSRAAFIKDCIRCTVLVAPIAGSVFVSHCVDSRIYVSCHQLRMKGCHNVDVYVWCASTPIIENCDGMRFGSYEKWTGLLSSTVPACGVGGAAPTTATHATHAEWVAKVGEITDVEGTRRSYETVDDFQWLKKAASPHWRVIAEDETAEESTPFSLPPV